MNIPKPGRPGGSPGAVGQRLKVILGAIGYTSQKDAASKLGVTDSTLSRILLGQQDPPFALLQRLVLLTSADVVDNLLTGRGSPSPGQDPRWRARPQERAAESADGLLLTVSRPIPGPPIDHPAAVDGAIRVAAPDWSPTRYALRITAEDPVAQEADLAEGDVLLIETNVSPAMRALVARAPFIVAVSPDRVELRSQGSLWRIGGSARGYPKIAGIALKLIRPYVVQSE